MKSSCLVVLLVLGLVAVSIFPVTVKAMDCTNLNMLAKGTIKNQNGVTVAENVWFTTYISLDDVTLTIGQNTWNQPGNAMVWGTTGEPNDITGTQKYIELSEGFTLVIDRLYQEGKAVTSISLQVTRMTTETPDFVDTAPSDVTQNTTDSTNGSLEQPGYTQSPSWPVIIVTLAAIIVGVGFMGWYIGKRKK